jgi:hypothetical protein
MLHRILLIAVSLLSTIGAYAATPDYFPLAVGNVWAYHGDGAGKGVTLLVSVDSARLMNGVVYCGVRWEAKYHPWLKLRKTEASASPLRGYHWLRRDEDGAIWAYDDGTRQEQLWYDFGGKHSVPVYNFYSTAIPGAVYHQAALANGLTPVKGVMGERDALMVEYVVIPYAGLDKEWFVPGIGLVEQQVATAQGPATFRLAYWRTAPRLEESSPEISFTLALDKPRYGVDLMPVTTNFAETLIARITLRNNTARPVWMAYNDGQRFDFVIRNAAGDEVYRWSSDKAFLQLSSAENFIGERTYVVAAPLVGTAPNDEALEGEYTAEAWLTSSPGTYSAKVGFAVRNFW